MKQRDSKIIATEIFGLLCSNLSYRLKTKGDLDILQMKKAYDDIILEGLLK